MTEKKMRRDDILEKVYEQMIIDLGSLDTSPVEELLSSISNEDLIQYLPEEEE